MLHPGRCAGAIKTPRDLGNERLAALGRDLENKALVFRKGEIVETVSVPRAMAASDTRPLIETAEATQGLALLPRFAAPKGWTECLTDWQLPDLEIKALSSPARGSLPKIRLFLDALRDGIRNGKVG